MASTPRVQDIARIARVSSSTVSHVLNGTAPISREVADRVLAAARETGYLAKRRRKAAVALLPTVMLAASAATLPKPDRNLFSWTMLNAFRQECRARGIRLIPYVEQSNFINPQGLIDAIGDARPNGVALLQDARPALLDAILDQDASFVILSGCDESMRVDSVTVGDRLGAAKATEYLMSLGHQRICFVKAGDSFSAQQRSLGFVDAHRARDTAIAPGAIIDLGATQQAGFEAALSDALPGPDAVLRFTGFICASDVVAIALVNTLQRWGYSVPDTVSVIGFDNVMQGEMEKPQLSTVHVPVAEVGQAALSLLEDARAHPKGERSARRVELGCRLVLRETTAAPRSNAKARLG